MMKWTATNSNQGNALACSAIPQVLGDLIYLGDENVFIFIKVDLY